jgi:RNA polymerase sigma factor (TIGR02999 family)
MKNKDSIAMTYLAERARQGDAAAAEKLMEALYSQMKPLAKDYMRREPAGISMETRDLVQEALMRLKLWDESAKEFDNRAHLLAWGALTMKRILSERGGRRRNLPKTPLEDAEGKNAPQDEPMNPVLEALDKLRKKNPRAARIVECRYYGGMTNKEVATVLQISEATVKRDWDSAKEFMYKLLKD